MDGLDAGVGEAVQDRLIPRCCVRSLSGIQSVVERRCASLRRSDQRQEREEK
jgi:hypothetical protein